MVAVAALAAVTALLGGSSRYDLLQNVALYPLTALAMIPALWQLDKVDLRSARVPLLLLGIFALWIGIQLVPLPPAIWHSLPMRSVIAAIDANIGTADTWRPISFVPLLTWNSLVGLLTVLAAILSFCALKGDKRPVILGVIAIGVASGTVGLLQLVGEQTRFLYFYSLTVEGRAVGLMANNNHAGILSALAMLAILIAWADREAVRRVIGLRSALPALFVYLALCGLTSTSRMGIAVTIVASCVGVIVLLFHTLRDKRDLSALKRTVMIAAIVSLILCVIGVVLTWNSFASLDQLGEKDIYQELRYRIAPTLFEMCRAFFFTGAGLGTFADVYHIFEPNELLMPRYLNQAHNDWLQFVIEAGLPGVLVLLGLLGWLGLAMRRLARGDGDDFIALLALAGFILVLAMASATDYALRTPIVQLVAVWVLVFSAHRAFRSRTQTEGAG